jgi:MoxR-like ATPase
MPVTQTPKLTQAPASQAGNPLEEARKKIWGLEKALNKIVIGREDVVRALVLSLVAREHIVVIGPPGTAKSYMALSLAKLLDARYYAYLMTRFSNYDEIFGPIDILELTTRSELRRKWSNIIEAEIIFLDEIFKANSAILNSLLSLMQERQIYDPMTGQAVPAKLWTLIAASNEIPVEEELQAVYDRFAVRLFISYLDNDEKLLAALQSRWSNNAVSTAPAASMEDVKTLHTYAVRLLNGGRIRELGEVIKLYYINVVPLLRTLRAKGIIISDRRIVEKAAMLYASYLAIYGVTQENIVNAVFDIVPLMASSLKEAEEIKKIIDDSLGEVAELTRKLEEAKRLIRAGQRDAAVNILKDVAMYDVTRLTSQPWLRPRVETLVHAAQEMLKELLQTQEAP